MAELDPRGARLLIAFEGGSVHAAERDGQYLLIIHQVALLDMLDEVDREGIEPVREIAFATAAGREAYVLERGWPSTSA